MQPDISLTKRLVIHGKAGNGPEARYEQAWAAYAATQGPGYMAPKPKYRSR